MDLLLCPVSLLILNKYRLTVSIQGQSPNYEAFKVENSSSLTIEKLIKKLEGKGYVKGQDYVEYNEPLDQQKKLVLTSPLDGQRYSFRFVDDGEKKEALKEDNQVKLVSFSVTPEIDSVPQLKKYAIEKGVIDSKWNLLTGDKKHIYDLARKSFFAAKNDGDGGKNDMIHTENFILVDPDKRIRGFYDGTDTSEMKSLLYDIRVLKKEYPSS